MSVRIEQKPGSSIIYLIDEENRAVTAKIPVWTMIESAYGDCNKYNLPPHGIWKAENKYSGKYFIGRAKCAPEDEFDIEKGKRLAMARMFKKYYKAKLEIYRDTAEYLDNQLTHCEDLLNINWLTINKYIEEEKTYYGDTNENSKD